MPCGPSLSSEFWAEARQDSLRNTNHRDAKRPESGGMPVWPPRCHGPRLSESHVLVEDPLQGSSESGVTPGEAS